MEDVTLKKVATPTALLTHPHEASNGAQLRIKGVK